MVNFRSIVYVGGSQNNHFNEMAMGGSSNFQNPELS